MGWVLKDSRGNFAPETSLFRSKVEAERARDWWVGRNNPKYKAARCSEWRFRRLLKKRDKQRKRGRR